MVELKTLKELRGYWMPNQVKARKFRMILESDLKQVAIKRIISYRQDALIDGKWDSEFLSGASNELQSFMNITTEDLNG